MITEGAVCGDSTVQGTPGGFSRLVGGEGLWHEDLADRLAAHFGPVLGTGYRGFLQPEWNEGGWLTPTTGQAWDKAPQNFNGRYTAGDEFDYVTWTKPVGAEPIVGFTIYWVDRPGGHFQYYADGVGTGVLSISGDNALRRLYVDLPVEVDVAIRGYSEVFGDTGPKPACIVGIAGWYLDPRTRDDGVVLHNLGQDGGTLANFTRATAGDWGAFLDLIDPQVLVGGTYTNDIDSGDLAAWTANWEELWDRVPGSHRILVNPFEQGPNNGSPAEQQTWRDAATAAAVSRDARVIDVYDLWAVSHTPAGIDGNVQAGLMLDYPTDGAHLSQRGHLDESERISGIVLVEEFGLTAGANPFILGITGFGDAALNGETVLLDTEKDLAATLAGTSAIEADLAEIIKAFAATLAATSTLTANLVRTAVLSASIAGTSALMADLGFLSPPPTWFLVSTLAATSTLEANAVATKYLAATLAGTGTLEAEMTHIVSLAATLAGTSSITAAAFLNLRISATIAAVGTMTAQITRQGPAVTGLRRGPVDAGGSRRGLVGVSSGRRGP